MTATSPGDGTVHELDGQMTMCGQDATAWSRTVTELQLRGLVLFCPVCFP